MTDKEKLALRVNEIFHDTEGKEYQKKHVDIFTGEVVRWQNTAKKYFQEYKSPINILDIGTGTGFIPLNTAEYLSENDKFICSDISQEMLDVAKKNIAAHSFNCKFDFLKLDGREINVNEITIITMNSVVHHIPNLKLFFSQINKIVSPGGRIIIGHEPNKLFYNQKFLVNLYMFLQTFSSLKKFATTFARITRINILLKKILKHKKDKSKIVSEINQVLIKEGTINEELTKNEINKMIDYHSPSAGAEIDKSKGIDIEELRKKYLHDFETEDFETYNFISKMSKRNSLMKRIDNSLSKKYKGKGATFFIVMKKKK